MRLSYWAYSPNYARTIGKLQECSGCQSTPLTTGKSSATTATRERSHALWRAFRVKLRLFSAAGLRPMARSESAAAGHSIGRAGHQLLADSGRMCHRLAVARVSCRSWFNLLGLQDQGSSNLTDVPLKSRALRVATMKLCSIAIAAIAASAKCIGLPAAFAALTT